MVRLTAEENVKLPCAVQYSALSVCGIGIDQKKHPSEILTGVS